VDGLLNESQTDGISASLSTFFDNWQNLSLRPADYSSRTALVTQSQNMLSLLRSSDQELANLQQQSEVMLQQEVTDLNMLLKRIADVNAQINVHDYPGENNANQLLDLRDQLVRQVAEKIDVRVIDKSAGLSNADTGTSSGINQSWSLITLSGQTLVQGTETFEVTYEGPQAIPSLSPGSTFDGRINFSGSSSFEYTVDVVRAGNVDTSSGAAMFRVSADGGMTWLKNADGTERHFHARPESASVNVSGVDIFFENSTQPLAVGDKFDVMPKNGLYWHENTAHAMNITPVIRADGSDDGRRATGGTIAGLFNLSSSYVGKYRDKLDAMTKTLIWEVNRLHSQGAGLTAINSTMGTYSVRDANMALGSDSSGLVWNDRLASGNCQVYIFQSANTSLASCASFGPLDFDPATAGIQNFDPSIHSLNDVRNAFNNTFGAYVSATIINNQLQITARPGYKFGFGDDSAGLLAGLGINTYFQGSSPQLIAVNTEVLNNQARLAAGHINGAGEFNSGDNSTAMGISVLRSMKVSIVGVYDAGSTQSILEYYSTTVATVGADTSAAKFKFTYYKSLADDLDERQNAVSGVNLDEEMSNLIKYQNSYRAAAKLITTADQMMQTILGLKQ